MSVWRADPSSAVSLAPTATPRRRSFAARLQRWGLVLACATLASCASPQIQDFQGQQPVLQLRDYFNGRLVAYGLFTDRNGVVQRRFTVQMKAHWQGPVGTLEEDFVYSDGKTERRVWTLTDHGNGRYSGRAADVVGEAQGQSAGPALRWGYTLSLPVDGKVYEVQFDDWMYLMGDGVMINKARMSKFGITLGEVTLAFRKLD